MKRLIFIILFLFLTACENQDNKTIFPLKTYSQIISDWIKTNDPNYDKPFMSQPVQKQRLTAFYNHLFGIYSPWNKEYVKKIIVEKNPDDIKTLELDILSLLDSNDSSKKAIGYGENFRPHSQEWLKNIIQNINLSQLNKLNYDPKNRGIAVDNLYARLLPTDDVHYYDYKRAGEGYPFDNLQVSALWAGTPVYIIAETKDHAWKMVLTPDYIAWVKSKGIARTNEAFIKTWTLAAKKQLAAITHTGTSIVNLHGNFQFLAYVGTVLPVYKNTHDFQLLIPVADSKQHAVIEYSSISHEDAMLIPAPTTLRNFQTIFNTLIGRPYGWGNLYFYNDCSAELKNLFTPFGIWLPRHSSDQVRIGRMVDMSGESAKSRLNYLMENGHRYMTLIYLGGHVVLYIGNFPNPNDKLHKDMAMTYQNMWGLSPHPATRRAIIGKSVFFPMLLKFPEDSSLVSQTQKPFFQISYLDELPNTLNKIEVLDLRALMYP